MINGVCTDVSTNRVGNIGGDSTDAFMGTDCWEACENYWLPQCNNCTGCGSGCPPQCNQHTTCTEWAHWGWGDPDIQTQWECIQYEVCCSPGSCYDDFTMCVAGCEGGGYGGKFGGRGAWGGRERKGGKIKRRR